MEEYVKAFQKILSAQDKVSTAKVSLDEAKLEMIHAKAELEKAMAFFESLITETGEYEVTIPGKVTDYKIGYLREPSDVVEIPDVNAVPDEFVEIERKPNKIEIKKHLKNNNVNWARLTKGEKKLSWQTAKK